MWQILSKLIFQTKRYLSYVVIFGLLITPFQPSYTYAQILATTTAPESSTEYTVEATPEEDPVVLIETGTAEAITESYNFSNTNDVNTPSSTQSTTSSTQEEDLNTEKDTSVPATDNASSTNEAIPTNVSTALETATTTTTSTAPATVVEVVNQATSTTTATTSAATGNNTATTSSSGTAIIASGDAYAYTNVVNLTNTNIINSDGFIMFLNQLFGTANIDFRNMFDVFSGTGTTSDTCPTTNCQSGGLETYITNQTTISNDITVVAETGNNQSFGGTAAVLTGDAYAAANVTNVANTNIIDANYLVMTFSNFGDLFGDIILPGANLLRALFRSSSSMQSDTRISNDASIDNQISTVANTGDNSSTGSSSVIETGNANTYTNVYNQTNTNIINNDSFTLLFRVRGDWAGEIFGLPEGLSYEHTPTGILISNATSQSTPATNNSISATITNDATITNNVSVSASSGNNQAIGNDLGYINTGDAYAAANVTNIANTNILGRNWSLLIFDIFGDWQGDISFGQPDIWIGGTANALGGTTAAGSEILYTFTMSNLGDATANNVVLNGKLNSDLITLAEPINDMKIGSIAPGETVEKSFVANVASTLPTGSFPVDLEAELTSNSPDADLTNNQEVVTVIAENNTYRGGGRSRANRSVITKDGDILITKTANLEVAEPGDTVSYEVKLTNSGGPIYDAILYDTLHDSEGTIMLDQNWPLYTIDTDETITIHYEVAFATSTKKGSYFNRAQMLGYHKNTNPKYMQTYDSLVATVPISIGEPAPTVLGITTTPTTTAQCTPYLTSFLKHTQPNNPNDVRRLQIFLSEQGLLTSPINDYFDARTADAVKVFQQQHADSILAPWGLNEPTGHVYYTTKKTINEIKCTDTTVFPLTSAQAAEIEQYKKNRFQRIPVATTPAKPVVEPTVTTPAAPPPEKPQVQNITHTPLAFHKIKMDSDPAEQTSPLFYITLSSLIQTGKQKLSRLKFW